MWDISLLAVALSALSAFVVGGLWYGPLFLKTWQREAGISEEDMRRRSPVIIFGGAFVLNLIAAYFIGHVLATYGQPPATIDIMIAFGLALAFICTAFGMNYLFAGKSFRLFAIDAGYWIVSYTIMGAIFGFLG